MPKIPICTVSDRKLLINKARQIRIDILEMLYRAQSSHIGSCYSCVEILTALYFKILAVYPHQPSHHHRDIFILSKGHAAAALYVILKHKQFLRKQALDCYEKDGSYFGGHPLARKIPGIEFATGSLGHGLGVGAGMALAAKRDGLTRRIFVLLSDGECDEGSVWESALFASHHQLDNLIAIIDRNRFQAYGNTEHILKLEPLAEKWRDFGWKINETDGHDPNSLIRTLGNTPYEQSKPNLLIAHTIKGKGVSFMENQLYWHYHSPDKNEYQRALKELKKR